MKHFAVLLILFTSNQARADLWGGDLPLLAQIVTNTLQTLNQLREQTTLMQDEMAGIKDKIYRIETIAQVVQPSRWEEWKDPITAMRRLETIYYTLPKEYRSDKSDAIAVELSKAMNAISRVGSEMPNTFNSGKELERRGADASPGVAQKLTASGIGTLIAIEAQSQVIQSHMTSLLTQMLAEANENESRSVVSRGRSFIGVSENLGATDNRFSSHVNPLGIGK